MKKGFSLMTISGALFLVAVLALSQLVQAAPQQGQGGPAKSTPAAKTNKAAAPTEPGDEYPRPPHPAKHYTVGVLLPMLSNPHFVGQAFGYTDEAEKLGASVILHEAGGYQYIEKQISQMEDLIASKVDAVNLVAINGSSTVPMVERAVAAGIPVFNCNVMTDSNKVITRVRSDDTVIGQMQADFMVKALGGKGNVVLVRGPAGTSWAQIRGDSFRKRVTEIAPGVKILGEQFEQATPPEGLRVMEDFLQTFPQIDGVYNGADAMGVGAAQAVRMAGKAGKIVITTTDLQPDAERFIREGVITASVVQQTVLIGRWCMRATINYLEKRPVPKELYPPLLLVTKSSIDTLDLRGVRAPQGWKPPVR